MGSDGELTGILREIVQFLECLREVKLPMTMEKIRDNLLIRSKSSLVTFMALGQATSTDAYLDMNVGTKSLLLGNIGSELQEYVGAEEPRVRKQHDYYETFQEVDAVVEPRQTKDTNQDRDLDTESALAKIYSTMSAAQTKSKCHKCGTLYRKEGKKLFVFEQYRACWVGLVGSHLLIYGNDRDNRPCMIQPIRGYSARQAPNAVPRDHRRSESAFEIFRPGCRTLQFVARTPKDMEQWVGQICEMGSDINEIRPTTEATSINVNADVSREKNREMILDNDPENSGKWPEEQYQDVGALTGEKPAFEEIPVLRGTASGPAEAGSPMNAASPPPLPARIPRRLPSLPLSGSVSSYEPQDDEEDDIYHRIEDLRDAMNYQNLQNPSGDAGKNAANRGSEEPVSYDDISTTRPGGEVKRSKEDGNRAKRVSRRISTEGETYDDIASGAAREKKTVAEDHSVLASYDDIENLALGARAIQDQTAEKGNDVTKSPQKKSFLDRVRSRRESPRKSEKKAKRKATSAAASPLPPSSSTASLLTNIEDMPMYDDVAQLASTPEIKAPEEELPEYNCPPPPRPVYVKPPIIPHETDPNEFYDDVSAYRLKDQCGEGSANVDQPTTTLSSMQEGPIGEECTALEVTETGLLENSEHYQTPRSDTRQHNTSLEDQPEELYDDIAILADFTARQRGVKDIDDIRGAGSPDRKPWNRFAAARKTRSTESTGSETNSRSTNGSEEGDEFGDQHGLIRMNTFQKLISKMENSLGKASAARPPVPFNRPHVFNNT